MGVFNQERWEGGGFHPSLNQWTSQNKLTENDILFTLQRESVLHLPSLEEKKIQHYNLCFST